MRKSVLQNKLFHHGMFVHELSFIAKKCTILFLDPKDTSFDKS